MIGNYLIHFLAIILVCSTILMFTAVNPINTLLLLISVFFLTSMIFMLVGVDFLGLSILLIYVGAIAVLFLFVVMMLNVRRIDRDNTLYLVIGLFITIILFLQFQYMGFVNNVLNFQFNLPLSVNSFSYSDTVFMDEAEKVKTVFCLGILLFGKFSICLIISAILLLVAMVGAICLTNEKRGYYVRQQYDQLIRLSNISVSFFY
jgi:NADH-quinone oxidoreductase subunit J